MDRAFLERRALRSMFTRCVTKLEEALSAQTPDSIGAAFGNLQEKRQRLAEIDNKIFSMWLDRQDCDEEFERDMEATEAYNEKWFIMEIKYNKATSAEKDPTHTPNDDYRSTSSRSESDKVSRLLKLPKLELPKFNGDLKTWINFWGIFEKIHNDKNMDDDIKFQYLAQCMEPGSAPHKLVSSYPPTAANYPNAVGQLKERFGRDELLIEIYVRELLTLILEQNKGGSIPLGTLYDKLKSQLNALESLGVTSDRCAAMLRPLVESALPVDLLRVWERRRKEHTDSADILSNLLDFIKLEVESEERIMIARPGTSASEPSTSCFTTVVKQTASTASLNRKCIFCDKATTHGSSECYKAMNMSLQERKDMVKSRHACFICLVPGHRASLCRKNPRCLICTKRHVTLLCGNVAENEVPRNSEPDHKAEKDERKLATLNQSNIATTVLLPTIVLDVVHNNKSVKVRALLDSGAQKSFINTSFARKLNLKPCGETQIEHNLFGGVVTKKEVHKSYLVTLKSVDRKFESIIEVLEQETICNDLPKASRDIIEAFKEKGVYLGDKIEEMGEVGLLIGADFLGTLMTGKVITLRGNLIAIESRFGWSVQGPTTSVDSININVNIASFDREDLCNEWPHAEVRPDIEEVSKEVKTNCVAVQTEESISDQLTYFSKHSKTVRTLAWCIRFVRNCRNKARKRPKIAGEITAEAYETAEKLLFKIIQKEEFTDIQRLKKSLNMEIFEDKEKLLRARTFLLKTSCVNVTYNSVMWDL